MNKDDMLKRAMWRLRLAAEMTETSAAVISAMSETLTDQNIADRIAAMPDADKAAVQHRDLAQQIEVALTQESTT